MGGAGRKWREGCVETENEEGREGGREGGMLCRCSLRWLFRRTCLWSEVLAFSFLICWRNCASSQRHICCGSIVSHAGVNYVAIADLFS